MAQFHPAEPLYSDRASLDDAALRHGGRLMSVGYGYSTTDSKITEAHGWRLKWVDRRGMGNHGTAVLIPTDARTRQLWRDGQMIWFRQRGIPEQYLAALVECREGRRHELADTLAAVLSDTALTRAVLDFGSCGGGQGLGGERDRWRENGLHWSIQYHLASRACCRCARSCQLLLPAAPEGGAQNWGRQMAHRTHRRIARRGEIAQASMSDPSRILRRKLITALRGYESDLDASYSTVRYGRVLSYRGAVIVGNELLIGMPDKGSPEMVTVHGWILRRPLKSVPTYELALVAWRRGLATYREVQRAAMIGGKNELSNV